MDSDTLNIPESKPESSTRVYLETEKHQDHQRRVSFVDDSGSILEPAITPTCTSTTIHNSSSLPPLHFTWRWKPIILYILFLILCNLIIPVILFYPLKHFTAINDREIVGISSAALGISSCFDAPLRLWRLTRHRVVYGPLGSDVWWHCDFMMWTYTFALLVFAFPLAIAPAIEFYDFFLMSTMMLVGPIGVVFLYSLLRPKLFCRCSSDPAGIPMKPALFYVFEDIASVDFQHGRPFRRALNDRYHASAPFRRLMFQLTVYWIISIIFYCAVTAAVTWASPFGFAFGWVLGQFFIWLILSIIGCYLWTKYGLAEEHKWWDRQVYDHDGVPSSKDTTEVVTEEEKDGSVAHSSMLDKAPPSKEGTSSQA